VMSPFVKKDAILYKAIVTEPVNVGVNSDFTENSVRAVFHYLVASTDIVTCLLNVSVTKAGMACFVRNLFVALIVIKREDIVRHLVNAVVD